MKRERYSTGTTWEPVVGYSRAVRAGQFVFVSSTTATAEDGGIVGEGDPYAQTTQAIKNIEAALVKVGATLHDEAEGVIHLTMLLFDHRVPLEMELKAFKGQNRI